MAKQVQCPSCGMHMAGPCSHPRCPFRKPDPTANDKSRARLPDRRQNETFKLQHEGHTFFVTVGYNEDGYPKEVFASGSKEGTAMSHIIADACVVISLALQYGASPTALEKSLGVIPDPACGEDATKPASVLGTIMEVLRDARIPSEAEWLGS